MFKYQKSNLMLGLMCSGFIFAVDTKMIRKANLESGLFYDLLNQKHISTEIIKQACLQLCSVMFLYKESSEGENLTSLRKQRFFAKIYHSIEKLRDCNMQQEELVELNEFIIQLFPDYNPETIQSSFDLDSD